MESPVKHAAEEDSSSERQDESFKTGFTKTKRPGQNETASYYAFQQSCVARL